MEDLHPHIQRLLKCIELEEKEQVKRYSLDKDHSLKSLKAEGLALHPLIITKKTFGYADYPEISFRLNFPQENQFRDGCAIECFTDGEEPIKGILLNLDGRSGEFRLFAPDYPDWLEDKGVGIKLSPDHRTTSIMKHALKDLPKNDTLFHFFRVMHDGIPSLHQVVDEPRKLDITNQRLNESQRNAVGAILNNQEMTIVHGPPGTGKTTTLIEAIKCLVKAGEKVLVSAPSNTAVDNIALGLHQVGLTILRIGNTTKVSESIFPFTPEGKLLDTNQRKEIKQLKIRAEEFRKMALKYKRSFGKAEREQRNLLFKEVKNIRDEIKKLQAYNEEKLYHEANVILGTPIGLHDSKIKSIEFDSLIMDEAGQCLEPLAWCLFPFAKKYVLAGDHYQLPPTVLSDEANRLGFTKSILEVCFANTQSIYLLDIQYRMRESIAGFSSQYFYDSRLKSAEHLCNTGIHIIFYDTAGSGHQEERGANGSSLQNGGELEIALKVIAHEDFDALKTAFISPYAGQVALAKESLPSLIRISTIDSFQGQEKETILISLVRSNDDGQIGFLNDYRRMNVAMTRAKENLVVIGDSATLGRDPFYLSFFNYIEKFGSYRSVWELE
ncbi:MAG TPA: AAA domain-containing protein [Chitinophagaceae bacterium]|nr:AAA domain-containing protein [Chitinophagaceae bacterium]